MQFRLYLVLWTSSIVRHSYSEDAYTSSVSQWLDNSAGPTASSASLCASALQPFNCNCDERNGLAVFCDEVDMTSIGPKIPNDTVHLEITNSLLPVFTKPLLSHLHDLRYLKLNHNAHRYITSKAFQGLDSLKALDLSFNDIIVLSKAFIHTPNLEVLNLTANQVINVKTIATALSHLENFQNLSLNDNYRIRKILSDELIPLSNTRLTKLELFNTTIRLIEQGSFRPLRHLKLLELSVNYVDETGLQNVTADLAETSIVILFLRYLNLQMGLPYDALSLLSNTSIQRLDLGYNNFRSLKKFPLIPTLTELGLTSCSIEIIMPHAFSDTPNLQILDLSENHITSLDENVFSLPSLKYLFLRNLKRPGDVAITMSVDDYAFRNLASLIVLDLWNTQINENINRYTFYGLRSLMHLFLYNSRIKNIEDFAFETLISLRDLDLQNNGLKVLTNHTFSGLRKLRTLSLSNNGMKFGLGTYPFQHSPLLSTVILHSNEIVEIPPNMFSRQFMLDILSLNDNKIIAWNSTVLAPEANVTLLLLSRNVITHVTSAMTNDFMRVTGTLDVTDNPFNCTECGMKDFQTFINETTASVFYIYSHRTGNYTCSSPEHFRGKSLLDVEIPTWHCVPQEINMAIFVIMILMSVVIPVALISVFGYVLRWYIRYWLFHLRATLKESKHGKGDLPRHYLYDAFVSYNASDTPWVVGTLIPALEEQEPRYKLCIHERDFEVGRLITDNILDTIEISRKVILLFSESFLASEWCLFELHMAQHKLFDETRDVLVLVKLKEIDKKFYTRNLKYLEKTRPCLNWTDSPVGQKLFWDKMRRILGNPSTDSQGSKKDGNKFFIPKNNSFF